MELLLKLKDLDRRIIFLFITFAVIVPMLVPIGFEVRPSEYVRSLHEFIDQLPAGTRTYLSFDYDPASAPELHPAAIAILVHMFRKDLKPICGANWPVGGDLAKQALDAAVTKLKESSDPKDVEIGKKLLSGRDFVNLGYKPGAIIQIRRMIADFLAPYPVDAYGKPTTEMEIFKNADGKKFSMKDIGIIVSFTAGTGGIESFISVKSEHERPMAAGCTSVNIPRFYTYIQTKQLIGMTGGMPGAAEYENLIKIKGTATSGMDSQSICHLVIIGFIILGNLAYMAEQRKAVRKA